MAPPASNEPAKTSRVHEIDPVWKSLRSEAEAAVATEPALAGFIYQTVLAQPRLEQAVVFRIARRLANPDVDANVLSHAFESVLDQRPDLGRAFRADLAAVLDRDPACRRLLEPLLYFKGFHALATHRFAHELLKSGHRDLALYLQSQGSRVFAVDINPAAKIGIGCFIDHGHDIVIGETAVVGDNVSMLQGVTLGGNGKDTGDRHPKIGNNVLIGAGAKVLGNIRIGDCSIVGAGSVVLKEVPPRSTVVGVPAKVIGPANCPEPGRAMDQRFEPGDCGCGCGETG